MNAQIVPAENLGNVKLLVHGLASGVDDGAIRRRAAGDADQNREREFEAGDLASVAVEEVHENAAAGLQLGQARQRGGDLIGTGTARADDRADEPGLLHRLLGRGEQRDRFPDFPFFLRRIFDHQKMALIAHDAGEFERRRLVDEPRQRDGWRAWLRPATVQPDVDFDHDAKRLAGRGHGLGQCIDLIGMIDRGDRVGDLAQSGQPLEL